MAWDLKGPGLRYCGKGQGQLLDSERPGGPGLKAAETEGSRLESGLSGPALRHLSNRPGGRGVQRGCSDPEEHPCRGTEPGAPQCSGCG